MYDFKYSSFKEKNSQILVDLTISQIKDLKYLINNFDRPQKHVILLENENILNYLDVLENNFIKYKQDFKEVT